MYCRYCGKELSNDSKFCSNCGKNQKITPSLSKTKFEDFIKGHKVLSYTYSLWVTLHITLLLCSEKEHSIGFYPWNGSINYVLRVYNSPYYNYYKDNLDVSLLDRYNVYDLSEFFFYTILFPIVVWGIIKIIKTGFVRLHPYVLTLQRKLKERYNEWKETNAKKVAVHHENAFMYKMPLESIVIPAPIQIKPMAEKKSCSEQQKTKNITVNNEDDADTNTLKTEKKQHGIDTNIEVKEMSILSRFAGSIIDKILILILFVASSLMISPYGAPGRFGTYVGLLNSSPRNYEYIDNIAMNRYGTYKEGVSQYYQDMEQIENEAPHIGSTLELDMTITFTFILANLIFYILFESILSASPGKRLFRGVIYDSDDEKIGFNKALTRGLCGGAMMAGIYYLLHVQGGVSNAMVVLIFFLILDIPVLIKRKSILDMCTGTIYKQQVKKK